MLAARTADCRVEAMAMTIAEMIYASIFLIAGICSAAMTLHHISSHLGKAFRRGRSLFKAQGKRR